MKKQVPLLMSPIEMAKRTRSGGRVDTMALFNSILDLTPDHQRILLAGIYSRISQKYDVKSTITPEELIVYIKNETIMFHKIQNKKLGRG